MKLMKQLFLILVIILFTGSILSAETNRDSFYKGSIALESSEYNDVSLVLKKFNMATVLWENAVEIRDDKKQSSYKNRVFE